MELSEDLEGTVAARPEKKKDRKMRDLCLLVNRNNYTNMSVSSEKKIISTLQQGNCEYCKYYRRMLAAMLPVGNRV